MKTLKMLVLVSLLVVGMSGCVAPSYPVDLHNVTIKNDSDYQLTVNWSTGEGKIKPNCTLIIITDCRKIDHEDMTLRISAMKLVPGRCIMQIQKIGELTKTVRIGTKSAHFSVRKKDFVKVSS